MINLLIKFCIDNWINEESGWVIDLINSEYLNVSTYAPLLGSSFIELPDKLKNSKKGLINFQMIIISIFYDVMLGI